MSGLDFIRTLVTGNMPNVRNLRISVDDNLPDAGLTMGTLIIGRQGTGKTSFLARHIVEYMKRYPKRAIFVLDAQGHVSRMIKELVLMETGEAGQQLQDRLICDTLGDPDYVIPLPEFSEAYGSYEEQVQRVADNLVRLAPELVKGAPFVAGLGLTEIFPQICRVLTAIRNENNECWQVTEVKKLIVDKALLRQAVAKFGNRTPEAKWFIEKVFNELSNHERELRTYAIIALLGAVESFSPRARIGYSRPGWTPKEVIAKGNVVLVDGSSLTNQKLAQHYLFTQAYSLIMAEINKRTPGDPNDEPVSLLMDEVPALLSIPGMAEEVGTLSPRYRSKKVQPYVALQNLSQLAKPLDQQIWSLGNKVVFGMENKEEAEKIAYQLGKYDPQFTKLPASRSYQNPVSEPERGQDRQFADWIHDFKSRECVIQKFPNEQEKAKYILYIPKTSEIKRGILKESVKEFDARKLRIQGVPVKDSLAIINNRKLSGPSNKNKQSPTL